MTDNTAPPLSISPLPAVQPRQAVSQLPPYHAPQEGRLGLTRLDFNENTHGLPVNLTDADWTAYPEYQTLTHSLAQFWGLYTDQVLLTNGSDEALFLVPFTFLSAGQVALVSQPTFQMIPHYLALCGATLHTIPVLPETFALDVAAWDVALAVHSPRLVILPSPDNPTGTSVPLDAWTRWLTRYPETLFVLDQAYGEYEPHADAALALIDQHPNLLITRTFSKAWGLAGLRLGVLLGQAALIQWLANVRSPFSVNQAAVRAVQALLPHAPQVIDAARATVTRKHQLMAQLASRGIAVHPAAGNFMLLKLGLDAAMFCQFMAAHGVLLRNRSSLLWGMVRLSVGTQAECDRFLALTDVYRDTTVLMFDLDDTLVDTSQSFDTVVMEMVAHFSGHPLSREQLYALRAEGGFNDDWVATAELLRRRGITHISADTITQTGSQWYLQRASQTEQLMLPLADLQALKGRFPKLAIATGRYRKEYAEVWANRLNAVFDTVVCVDDDPSYLSKPHPATLQAAVAQTGCQRGFYLGNAVDDMRAAQAAGLIPVGVQKTLTCLQLAEAGAHYILDDITDWPNMLPVANYKTAG
jgi:histidinol-phosphate aminotransferase